MLDAFVPIEGMEPVGEIRIVPDPDTYRLLPWLPRTASLLCDQLDHDFEDWGSCTRSFLKRAIAAAEEMGIEVMAAFENEFYLAHEVDGGVEPYQDGPVYSSAGMDRVADVMDDILAALEAQGLDVEQAINEYGPGQQEIAIRYDRALDAADNQLRFRDTVRGVTEVRHGLICSFAAKPFAHGVGSGAHIHFSLWSPDGQRNLLYDAAAGERLLSETGRQFVAGVLAHLPALVALTCPSFNSYERLQPRAWAGLHGLAGGSTIARRRARGVLVPGPRGGVDERRAQGLRPELQPVPRARRAHPRRPRRHPPRPASRPSPPASTRPA